MFKSKTSAGLASTEASLFGWQTAAFSLGPHIVFPLCACTLRLFVCLNFLSYKETCQIGLEPK